MENVIRLPSISKPGARDAFLITDMTGLAHVAETASNTSSAKKSGGTWSGGRAFPALIECLRNGELTGVAESDRLMTDLENKLPSAHSAKFRVQDDVCGAYPNIPAFIAGVPLSMRRRIKTVSESAPLTVFADITASAGIDVSDLRKRGAAILAMVRLLSERRPVELFAVVGAGNSQTAMHVMTRIETAPLDLACAAFALTDPGMMRGIGFSIIHQAHLDGTLGTGDWHGGWAYSDDSSYRKGAEKTMHQVMGTNTDALYIPAAHVADEAIKNPVKWLLEKLAQYGGATLEAAE